MGRLLLPGFTRLGTTIRRKDNATRSNVRYTAGAPKVTADHVLPPTIEAPNLHNYGMDPSDRITSVMLIVPQEMMAPSTLHSSSL